MKCGTPRNDKLVRRETEEQSRKVRSYYGIAEDEKIVLYAPTYRPMEKELSLNSDRLLAELGKSGERYCLLYRGHRYQKAEELQITGERIVNASDYPDMQELLCAADMMITDYSSSVWDYSFLYRPCFLYVPDLNEYRKLNGFYVDVEDWPFALAQTEEELCRVIANYDETEAIRKIKEHHAYMGNYESGHACEEIAEYIRKVVGEQR